MIRFIALLATIAVVSGATNYCDSTLCGGKPHIGCNNVGAFGPDCPSSRQLVEITSSIKDAILHSHNLKRSTIADGKLAGFLSATQMATMRWSDELAKLAEYNVKRCLFEHDKCHNTIEFKYSGQNIAAKWTSAASINAATDIPPMIDSWWSEYTDATMSYLSNYTGNPPNKVIGHFTVMTSDKNTHVGCAAIFYPDPKMQNWNAMVFTCNYARTNMLNRRLYEAGATGSKCTTGRNPNYQGLCAIGEPYNVNDYSK